MKSIRHFLPFVIWFIIILYLSFMPLQGFPKLGMFEKLYFDKVVHIIMYATLCFLLLRGFFRQQLRQVPRYSFIIGSIVFSALTGILIEFLQPMLTMYRQFETLDMVANSAGAIAGYYFFRWMLKVQWMF